MLPIPRVTRICQRLEMRPEMRPERINIHTHKTANVLNNLPKSIQPNAKAKLHEIWMAPTRRAYAP